MNFFVFFLLALLTPASAKTEIKVMGSPSSIKQIQKKEQEKKIASTLKVNFTYHEGTSEKGSIALVKDFIDLASFAESPEVALKKEFAKSRGRQEKVEDFEWKKYAETPVKLVMNPKNTVASLDDEKIGKIIRGEIKNWSELGGSNLPVNVCSSRSSFVAHREMLKIYNGEKEAPWINIVADQVGITNFLKKDLGAACIATAKIELPDGAPLEFKTKAVLTNYIVYKKSATDVVRKAAEMLGQ